MSKAKDRISIHTIHVTAQIFQPNVLQAKSTALKLHRLVCAELGKLEAPSDSVTVDLDSNYLVTRKQRIKKGRSPWIISHEI